MVDMLARSRQSKSALLFGSQLLSPGHEILESIRLRLVSSDKSLWILETLAELPDWLEGLRDISHDFHQSAKDLLVEMNRWLRTDRPLSARVLSSNVTLTPLTVIHQLIQYESYLDLVFPELDVDRRFASLRYSTETVGFCTGLLSASAISSTRDRGSFEKYAASAIRIAMLCGLVVDAENQIEDGNQATSLATVWHSPEAHNQMVEALESFPGVCQSFPCPHI